MTFNFGSVFKMYNVKNFYIIVFFSEHLELLKNKGLQKDYDSKITHRLLISSKMFKQKLQKDLGSRMGNHFVFSKMSGA